MNTPNLMLHCGATLVERNELEAVALPPTTRTYCPIGHETFVGLVQDKLSDIGFRFGTEAHSLTKEGNRYFGMAHLMNGTEQEDHALVVGMRSSMDKSFPASVAFGSSVFVCDNLCFSGEVSISRKHTTNIMRDLPNLVATAVGSVGVMQANQTLRYEQYREVKITSKRADHLIIEMLRREVINTSRVEKVVAEWDEPSHDEFAEDGRSVWRLFNATTEALKGSPLQALSPRTIQLTALMDQAARFVPTANVIDTQ